MAIGSNFRRAVAGLMMTTTSLTTTAAISTLSTVLVTAAAIPASAQSNPEFQKNERGTNIRITFKEGYEQYADYFADPKHASTLANALITAERKRTRSGGDPDNNRPNSSEYEKVLSRALGKVIFGSVSLSKITNIQTEEASAHHLSRAEKGSGMVTIRFTSSGPGPNYEEDLSARVSAGGRSNSFGNVNFAPARPGNNFTP